MIEMYLEIVDNVVIHDKKKEYVDEAIRFSKDLKCLKSCIKSNVYSENDSDIVSIMTEWEEKESMESEEAGNVFLDHKSRLKPFFIKNDRSVYKRV